MQNNTHQKQNGSIKKKSTTENCQLANVKNYTIHWHRRKNYCTSMKMYFPKFIKFFPLQNYIRSQKLVFSQNHYASLHFCNISFTERRRSSWCYKQKNCLHCLYLYFLLFMQYFNININETVLTKHWHEQNWMFKKKSYILAIISIAN